MGRNRWVVMGDLNGQIGLMEELVKRNGQLLLYVVEESVRD